MFKWLAAFWRKIEGWLHPRADAPHAYHRSNLHGRIR